MELTAVMDYILRTKPDGYMVLDRPTQPEIGIRKRKPTTLYLQDEGMERAEAMLDLEYGWRWYQEQQEQRQDDGIDVVKNDYSKLPERAWGPRD